MLVLSRKEGETIYVGSDVEIVVCEIRGKKVRIGVRAPEDIRILRSEIKQAIERDQGGVQLDLKPVYDPQLKTEKEEG